MKTNDASIPKVARRGRKRKVTICLITHLTGIFGCDDTGYYFLY